MNNDNLSAIPNILAKIIGGDHHFDKVILLCLDRNDYVTYEKTDNVLNDDYDYYADTTTTTTTGDTVNKKRRIISDIDNHRHHHKKQKTSTLSHCDNPIAYTKHIIKMVFDSCQYKDQGLITTLAYTAFMNETPFSLSGPAILQFVKKKITNVMLKRKPKSKEMSGLEKGLTKKLIKALL